MSCESLSLMFTAIRRMTETGGVDAVVVCDGGHRQRNVVFLTLTSSAFRREGLIPELEFVAAL